MLTRTQVKQGPALLVKVRGKETPAFQCPIVVTEMDHREKQPGTTG